MDTLTKLIDTLGDSPFVLRLLDLLLKAEMLVSASRWAVRSSTNARFSVSSVDSE